MAMGPKWTTAVPGYYGSVLYGVVRDRYDYFCLDDDPDVGGLALERGALVLGAFGGVAVFCY